MATAYDIIESDTAAKLADELGELNAKIAALQVEAKEIKAAIVETGFDSIEGDDYTVAVVRADRKTVDWQKIARDLGATARKIAANTKVAETVSVRVFGRSAKVA